jgi:hypothetical protein
MDYMSIAIKELKPGRTTDESSLCIRNVSFRYAARKYRAVGYLNSLITCTRCNGF